MSEYEKEECPDFDDYPHPCLAQEMWGEKEEIGCVGCDSGVEYLIPMLCETHYLQWMTNKQLFERKHYHD